MTHDNGAYVTLERVFVGPAIWEWRGRKWAHLTADDLDTLHAFATRLQLKPEWFQTKPSRPWFDHYDVTDHKREQALKLGAIPLDFRAEAHLFLAKREGKLYEANAR